MALCCFRFLPGLRLSHRLIDRETLRAVRGYSVDAFLAMVAGRVTVQTGTIVVGGFLTVARRGTTRSRCGSWTWRRTCSAPRPLRSRRGQ
jgi:hypothetical protein